MKSYKLNHFALPTSINYTESLNPQQLQAVQETDGPSLVLAGAGSGKTRVLIYRLAYLLERGVRPEQILLVTFTNKAAKEMMQRAENLLQSTLKGIWAGTFHHVGNMILRKESEALGYAPNFTIIDKEDTKDLIEDCLEELGLAGKQALFPKKDVISSVWDLAVNSQKEIEEVVLKFYPHIEEHLFQIKRVLHYFERKKKETNTMDFNDLLSNWLKVLKNEELCKKYAEGFHYILVDEYQDTNRIQFEILKKLSFVHKNILAVGDDAQSIYSFRGAEINNLLDFPKVFEGAKIFKLETNYRSSPEILALANKIITHNTKQFPKTLKAIKEPADIPLVIKTKDVYLQAKFVAQRIMELSELGIPLKEIAVLFRSHFQVLEIEIELLKRDIAYIVRGGVRFFEQAHIKDVLSYLKLISNPRDELSFKRAISLYKGIGRSYANKIWKGLTEEGLGIVQLEKNLPQKQRQGCREFFSLMEKLKAISSPLDTISKVLTFYKDYCYLTFDNADDRILDLEELAKMASDYPTVKRFLAEFGSFENFKGETMVSAPGNNDYVTLSTIHQAKGLEWTGVFIIGFNDYEFPHPKALASASALEEERRLFYVATTRAKTFLYITYPETKYTFKNGLVISRPSMFFHELPPEVYEEMFVEENG
ncbi:MAG: ATP-dependent helicase [Candidatus Omnitrophota bacterium]